MGPWFTYILECRGGSLYVGITNDLDARLRAHNAGRGARYTAGRRPVVLRYQESHPTRSAALKRECAIKRWRRGKKQVFLGAWRA